MQATSFGTVQGGIGGGEYGFGLFERERFRWSAWLAGGDFAEHDYVSFHLVPCLSVPD
jgi:hypothetical protein